MITAEQLRQKVRRLLNEVEDDAGVTLLSDDTRSLDEHIEALMPDAVQFIQMNKGYGMVNPKEGHVPQILINDNGDGTGNFVLPEDFVSLLSFKMNGWARPCTTLYPDSSQVALAQHNPYTRAGYSRPVCTEGLDPSGRRLLCFYSLPPGVLPVISQFVYEAAYNSSDGLSGNNATLHNAVAYQCAALLCNMFERRDNAGAFFRIAASLCNNVKLDNNK